MPLWSLLLLQDPKCEGYHRWAALWSKSRQSMELSILDSSTLFSSLQQTWSNNNLWLSIFIHICHKNTILATANTHSIYVIPLYYVTKWYLRSIPSQICYLKVANSIAHGYDFIETNLGKYNLTKLANNKATKKLKYHQCLIHHHLLIVLEVNCLHCLCKFEWANWIHMTK